MIWGGAFKAIFEDHWLPTDIGSDDNIWLVKLNIIKSHLKA